MIQQDYILRIIREFMEALQLFVSRQKDIKKKEEKILELYTAYVGDPVFYHTAAMDDVMDSFTQWPVEERLYRMENFIMPKQKSRQVPPETCSWNVPCRCSCSSTDTAAPSPSNGSQKSGKSKKLWTKMCLKAKPQIRLLIEK